MTLPSWSTVADYLDELLGCGEDQDASILVFKRAVAPFAIDTFACGKVHLRQRQLNAFYAVEWPEAWRNFYVKSGLINRDPLIERLETSRRPFTWSELRRDRLLSKAGSEALRSTADYGWTEGLAVPVDRDGLLVGMVSLVARRGEFDAGKTAYLSLLSTHFYQRMRELARLKGCVMAPAGLTPRELACVQLIATGCSDRLVGEALKISTATAHEHVEKAKAKLGASTRAGAVAVASSLGIIRVGDDR